MAHHMPWTLDQQSHPMTSPGSLTGLSRASTNGEGSQEPGTAAKMAAHSGTCLASQVARIAGRACDVPYTVLPPRTATIPTCRVNPVPQPPGYRRLLGSC